MKNTKSLKSKKKLLSRRTIALIIIDTIILIAMYLSMGMMSDMAISSFITFGQLTVPKFLGFFDAIIIFRWVFDVYRSVWRYANTVSYLKLVLADLFGATFYFLIGRYVIHSIYIGFSYTLVMVLLVILFTLLSRFAYQLTYALLSARGETSLLKLIFGRDTQDHKIYIAIVGAGDVGAALAEELLRNKRSHYVPYCFVDKDARKIGSGINGIPIIEEDENIVESLKELPVQEIVIAIAGATSEDKERLYTLYSKTGCKIKNYDYPLGEEEDNGIPRKRSLQEFKIEDFLFRDSLKINGDLTKKYYTGKTIMVTGGGGSIGSELCRQVAKLSPKKLIIVDIYENNAYDIQQELVRKYGDKLNLEVIIASVRDQKRLEEIFFEQRPEVVLHAAAHKHVPLMEHSGCEAIKNNVLGTYNVANMAEKYGVKKFLLISTDKAVNPTNIMGASKRLCEMVIQCREDSKTEFTAVRFGNVLGSNGSVIPLFRRQIESGGPVTITDKRIIRYFMTIPEAAQLVMEAGAMAKNGELYVLDMGKPVKILDLAEKMVEMAGLTPYQDIDIVEIGLRPGEKLYEELLMKNEDLGKTDNEMIFIERDKGYSREEVEEKLSILKKAISDSQLGTTANAGHHDLVLEAIKATVPTFKLPEEVNKNAAKSEEMKIVNNE